MSATEKVTTFKPPATARAGGGTFLPGELKGLTLPEFLNKNVLYPIISLPKQ